MEKLQITKGQYSVKPATRTDCASIVINHQMMVMIMPLDTINDEIETNTASVCSDALNTYQQFETLPSELLRQNREMKEALENTLKELLKLIDHCENEHFLDFDDESIEGVADCNKVMKQARNCLTSCNKGKDTTSYRN